MTDGRGTFSVLSAFWLFLPSSISSLLPFFPFVRPFNFYRHVSSSLTYEIEKDSRTRKGIRTILVTRVKDMNWTDEDVKAKESVVRE